MSAQRKHTYTRDYVSLRLKMSRNLYLCKYACINEVLKNVPQYQINGSTRILVSDVLIGGEIYLLVATNTRSFLDLVDIQEGALTPNITEGQGLSAQGQGLVVSGFVTSDNVDEHILTVGSRTSKDGLKVATAFKEKDGNWGVKETTRKFAKYIKKCKHFDNYDNFFLFRHNADKNISSYGLFNSIMFSQNEFLKKNNIRVDFEHSSKYMDLDNYSENKFKTHPSPNIDDYQEQFCLAYEEVPFQNCISKITHPIGEYEVEISGNNIYEAYAGFEDPAKNQNRFAYLRSKKGYHTHMGVAPIAKLFLKIPGLLNSYTSKEAKENFARFQDEVVYTRAATSCFINKTSFQNAVDNKSYVLDNKNKGNWLNAEEFLVEKYGVNSDALLNILENSKKWKPFIVQRMVIDKIKVYNVTDGNRVEVKEDMDMISAIAFEGYDGIFRIKDESKIEKIISSAMHETKFSKDFHKVLNLMFPYSDAPCIPVPLQRESKKKTFILKDENGKTIKKGQIKVNSNQKVYIYSLVEKRYMRLEEVPIDLTRTRGISLDKVPYGYEDKNPIMLLSVSDFRKEVRNKEGAIISRDIIDAKDYVHNGECLPSREIYIDYCGSSHKVHTLEEVPKLEMTRNPNSNNIAVDEEGGKTSKYTYSAGRSDIFGKCINGMVYLNQDNDTIYTLCCLGQQHLSIQQKEYVARYILAPIFIAGMNWFRNKNSSDMNIDIRDDSYKEKYIGESERGFYCEFDNILDNYFNCLYLPSVNKFINKIQYIMRLKDQNIENNDQESFEYEEELMDKILNS